MMDNSEHKKVIRCISNINIKCDHSVGNCESPKLSIISNANPASSSNIGGNGNTGKSQNSIAKILLLGSAKVGKTSIIQRFLNNKFENRYVPTVEDVHNRKFVARNKIIQTEIIDTCGSFHFPAMIRLCITKATAFILVFSNDDLESFNKCKELLQEIKSVRLDNESDVLLPPIVIVCNKSDLSTSNQIDEEKIMEWLVKSALKPSQFVYSSAKNNESIMSIFDSLYHQNELINLIELEPYEDPSGNGANIGGGLSSSGSHLDQHKNDEAPISSENHNNNHHHNSHHHPKQLSKFRASFRLSRKTSQKKDKYKVEYTHLNCNVS